MSIDNLKSLMDGFDPASLLPQLDTIMGKMEFAMRIAVLAGPVILFFMGLAYLLLPPKEANYYFGYRCYFGMGSVNAWRFTQRLAGLIWTLLGLGLGIVMAVISSGFAGMEIMDMIWAAGKCVLWEAVIIGMSCLVINALVAIRYNSEGERRGKKAVK
ncbi:MAG: SdpI family protein [Oscillospiraceae bacterium]|nr:SdpI family protein [Oscillospiraceae bacterium]